MLSERWCWIPMPGYSILWSALANGDFSVKSVYSLRCARWTKCALGRIVWKSRVPARCKFFMFLVMRGACLTADNLQRCRWHLASLSPLLLRSGNLLAHLPLLRMHGAGLGAGAQPPGLHLPTAYTAFAFLVARGPQDDQQAGEENLRCRCDPGDMAYLEGTQCPCFWGEGHYGVCSMWKVAGLFTPPDTGAYQGIEGSDVRIFGIVVVAVFRSLIVRAHSGALPCCQLLYAVCPVNSVFSHS